MKDNNGGAGWLVGGLLVGFALGAAAVRGFYPPTPELTPAAEFGEASTCEETVWLGPASADQPWPLARPRNAADLVTWLPEGRCGGVR